jgi:Zn-dependent M28 family amino/carboxypeptidase
MDERLPGDRIFNGAADNAAGTAVLLEIARTLSTGPAPSRSILFLSVTAEEKGLLGARYYARQPLYPLRRTLGVINMDGANQFGPTRDLEIVGLGSTTMEEIATEIAKGQGRTVRAESNPERGTYFRSDHFEFAKVGVPGFYSKAGRDFIGQPADFADRKVNEYIARDYHQPSDEVKPDWTFAGAAQDASLLAELGRRLANEDRWPEWKPGSPFRDRREKMLRDPR